VLCGRSGEQRVRLFGRSPRWLRSAREGVSRRPEHASRPRG
jgi:hypothetical protein